MDIKQSLIINNEWWQEGEVNSKYLLNRKREEYNDVIEKIEEKRILY